VDLFLEVGIHAHFGIIALILREKIPLHWQGYWTGFETVY